MTTIKINGREYSAEVDESVTLLDFIRDKAQLTGTKMGCNNGDCGSCTVLLDGRPVLSCLMLARQAEGRSVTTIEGVAADGALHPVQKAFVDAGAIQCGYCTPGMVMAAIGLLSENSNPTETEIREAMVGHLCRCSGYANIVSAVALAAKRMSEISGKIKTPQGVN